jgi:hypothetical protein
MTKPARHTQEWRILNLGDKRANYVIQCLGRFNTGEEFPDIENVESWMGPRSEINKDKTPPFL